MTPGDPALPLVRPVAGVAERVDGGRDVLGADDDVDVDDGFCGEPGDGGAADVFDGKDGDATQLVLEPEFEVAKLEGVEGVVGEDFDFDAHF